MCKVCNFMLQGSTVHHTGQEDMHTSHVSYTGNVLNIHMLVHCNACYTLSCTYTEQLTSEGMGKVEEMLAMVMLL